MTVAGVFVGYLRFGTDSVGPTAVGHTAHNVFFDGFGLFTVASSPLATYLAGDSGILLFAGYAVLAGSLLCSP